MTDTALTVSSPVRPARSTSRPAGTARAADAGFTLVELLVVMAILAMLATVVAPRVVGYLGSSRVKTAKVQIESLATSLELFRLDVGRYPTSDEGLAALVRPLPTVASWNGPYLKAGKLPTDPWGAPFQYASPGRHGGFDIQSLGADGKVNGDGENQDITSW